MKILLGTRGAGRLREARSGPPDDWGAEALGRPQSRRKPGGGRKTAEGSGSPTESRGEMRRRRAREDDVVYL